ncbi:UNVERIFIED_CONTAM: hypothetical protein Slati_1458600 [Sesamum latifolium]|uniref:Reverse transcriptase domain-containing protein n=1 Tax=Sesamum latifolium TaxID=2727402 RepID=A0AAW2X4A5_9LAMI
MNLDFVDKAREMATARAAMYKVRMAKTYNARVRPGNFQVGDLVLRKVEASGPIGKLDPKWEGPYKVVEIVIGGAYKLQQMDGKSVPRTWNVANLKKYYTYNSPRRKCFLLFIGIDRDRRAKIGDRCSDPSPFTLHFFPFCNP